jgi:hypothetical protein
VQGGVLSHSSPRSPIGAQALSLFTVLAFGAAVGVLPLALFLGSWRYFAVYATVSAVLAVIVSIRVKAPRSALPGIVEYVDAAVAATAMHGSGALAGLMFYGFTWLVVKALGLGVEWIGWAPPGWDAHEIAGWPAMVITVLVGFAVPFGGLPSALFAEIYSTRRVFGVPGSFPRLWSVVAIATGLSTVGWLYFFGDLTRGWYLLGQPFVTLAGVHLLGHIVSSRSTAMTAADTVAAVGRLYQALGYTTVARPRADEADKRLSWLLARLDLIATRGDECLAVVVLTPETGTRAVAPEDVSLLPHAARALSGFLKTRNSPSPSVRPVLLLTGRSPTKSLEEFAAEESIEVICTLDETVLREALAGNDLTALRPKAEHHLGRESVHVAANGSSLAAG